MNRNATVERIYVIDEHPNADALEIAHILGYQCIVRKGQFKEREYVVFVPEQMLVPDYILKNLGLWDEKKQLGKLAGPEGNRVKVTKLRGVQSYGLVIPFENGVIENHEGLPLALEDTYEGEPVSEFFGFVKWEPTIPTSMSGEVCHVGGKTIKYDIENVRNHPDILDGLTKLGIPCVLTEKLHGTWCCIAIYPEQVIHPEIPEGNVIVTSKGLSAKNLAFKDNKENERNIYLKIYRELERSGVNLNDFAKNLSTDDAGNLLHDTIGVFFLGEVFGRGIQDLTYGLSDAQFRLFDIFVGSPDNGSFLPYSELREKVNVHNKLYTSDNAKLECVPELYRGPLNLDIVHNFTNGKDNITGKHMREGVVIRPLDYEITDSKMGSRMILKSVSDDYLNRKGGTEYN